MKKRRSFGSIFVSFIRGIITLALIIVLIASVAVNVLFYSEDSVVKIDALDYHYSFFINNNDELENIKKGALVIANHGMNPESNRYVLCTIGNDYTTVLCLANITENSNGSRSCLLIGDKQESEVNYTIPDSKINGIVIDKDDMIGDVIAFMRKIPGIATLMAIPAFLLIIMCITGIKRNRNRYEDDVLEAEILAEELRKVKKINDRKDNDKKKNSFKMEEPPVPAPAQYTPSPDAMKKSTAETDKDNYIAFDESSTSKKPVAVSENVNEKVNDVTEKPVIAEKKAEPVLVAKPDIEAKTVIKSEEPAIEKSLLEDILAEKSTPAKSDTDKISESREEKKESRPQPKKFDAKSIDELIKLLDAEKKKLDDK